MSHTKKPVQHKTNHGWEQKGSNVAAVGSEHGSVGVFSYHFTVQKCFSSSTSALNTTLALL